MILDFDTIPAASLAGFKGGEGALEASMHFDGMNRILRGRLDPSSTIGLHTHDTSSEIIFITAGTAHMIMDGVDEYVHAGQVHYCPKGHTHTMLNDGPEDVCFVAVVPEQ